VGVKVLPMIVDQSLSLEVGVEGPSPTTDHSLRLSSSEPGGSGRDSFLEILSEEELTKPERCEI
jgi:hypothetical protein